MESRKPRCNIALLGHIGCGKSTVGGRLLYQCGCVGQSIIDQYRDNSGAANFAWVLDRTQEERSRGVTIDLSFTNFETSRLLFTVVNIPGHRNYIKTMICGAHCCDVGILVVSAVVGEMEDGLKADGQTREHSLLAYTMGIKQLICCVNKMDLAEWSQSRFEEVTKETSDYLRKVGYNPSNVPFVPVSGALGDNMIEQSIRMKWYSGPTLLDVCDRVQVPARADMKPLRVTIHAARSVRDVGTVLIGKVETGILQADQPLVIGPEQVSTIVRSIEIHSERMETASSGDIIAICPLSMDYRTIHRGMMAYSSRESPATECRSFTAQIIILNCPSTIKAGYTPTLHCHMASVQCRLAEIVSKIDRRTGIVIEERPVSLKAGNAAVCKFVPMKAICMETFPEFPTIGRFALRDSNRTVAVGVVKEVTRVGLGEMQWKFWGSRKLVG